MSGYVANSCSLTFFGLCPWEKPIVDRRTTMKDGANKSWSAHTFLRRVEVPAVPIRLSMKPYQVNKDGPTKQVPMAPNRTTLTKSMSCNLFPSMTVWATTSPVAINNPVWTAWDPMGYFWMAFWYSLSKARIFVWIQARVCQSGYQGSIESSTNTLFCAQDSSERMTSSANSTEITQVNNTDV